ncbi:MAG: hypothetical protein IJ688_10145 [Treponema sp.]|nr:hypothetical protein [Treponema sp.]
MPAYIAIILSVINIILLLYIIIRFKKLFSTDGIIEKTKSQMNKVIADINNNADRDIKLVNETSRRIKALMNDADKKMDQFRQASELLKNTIAEADSAVRKNGRKTIYVQNERLAAITPVGNPNAYVNPSAAYAANTQQSLFEEENTVQPSIADSADEINVREDGAAYKQVPLFVTKVYEDKPLGEDSKNSKSINKKVEKLYEQGYKIEEIAAQLSCSISEVQFIIDLAAESATNR